MFFFCFASLPAGIENMPAGIEIMLAGLEIMPAGIEIMPAGIQITLTYKNSCHRLNIACK